MMHAVGLSIDSIGVSVGSIVVSVGSIEVVSITLSSMVFVATIRVSFIPII
jgi:hypothetical protein